jgi:hypothetical protein
MQLPGQARVIQPASPLQQGGHCVKGPAQGSEYDSPHDLHIHCMPPAHAGHNHRLATQGSQAMDQKRKSALRRWRDRRKLRRIERLERKIISRETLRDFTQRTGDDLR